jgi:hypothetical protein
LQYVRHHFDRLRLPLSLCDAYTRLEGRVGLQSTFTETIKVALLAVFQAVERCEADKARTGLRTSCLAPMEEAQPAEHAIHRASVNKVVSSGSQPTLLNCLLILNDGCSSRTRATAVLASSSRASFASGAARNTKLVLKPGLNWIAFRAALTATS